MSLYALDCLLEDLERLNELEVVEIPRRLQEQFERADIQCRPGVTVTRLIEQVFEKQEAFVGTREQGGRLKRKAKPLAMSQRLHSHS